MKLRLFSPRLFLRAVRALERIADALESARDGFYLAYHIPRAVVPTTDDTDPEQLVSYSTDRDTWELQQRDAAKRANGFPVPDADLAPRH